MINSARVRSYFGVGDIKWFKEASFISQLIMLLFCKEREAQELIGDVTFYKYRDTMWITKFVVDPTYFAMTNFIGKGSEEIQ